MEDFSCKTIAKLEMVDGKYIFTQAEMFPVIKLTNPDKDAVTAHRLAKKAEAGCLVTNSMKTEIIMTAQIS